MGERLGRMRPNHRHDITTFNGRGRNQRGNTAPHIGKGDQVNRLIKATGAAFAFGALVLLASYFTIDQGERGVVLRNGAFSYVAEPGLNFSVPIITSVEKISVQEKVSLYEGLQSYSKDQQPATMRVSVSFQIPVSEVSAVYSQYGTIDNLVSRLLDRQVPKVLEEVFGHFNAVTAIQDRINFGAEFQAALQKAVVGPIVIKSVQIENIDFSSAYETSVENRMLAEVEVQKVRQNAEKEKITAEITVIKAQAAADSQVASAKAQAVATRLAGEAEAAAITAKGEALAKNPQLVDLIQAERWNGVLPTQMIPSGAVPFLNVR